VLHDIGKVRELSYERSINYTTEGILLGHIIIELDLVTKRMDAIQGFPAPLRALVQHLLISHHGRYEFGSPRLPMFREAVLLHYLDDLDSKMGAMRATLASDKGEGEWSAYNAALERRLLRLERYLSGEAPSGAAQAELPLKPPREEK
jgi:3'-5' exoribonuclease